MLTAQVTRNWADLHPRSPGQLAVVQAPLLERSREGRGGQARHLLGRAISSVLE